MASAIINVVKGLVFLIVAASGIVSLYAAVDAASIYTGLSVFVAGLLVIVAGVVVAPFFCFIAAYGMVYFLDQPLRIALVVVAPVLIAWSVAAVRLMRQSFTR